MQPAPEPFSQPMYPPMPQMLPGPNRRMNWVILIGGVLILAGLLMLAVTDFSFASIPSTASYDSIRWTYQVYAAGEITEGIGFLVALVGLAFGRR